MQISSSDQDMFGFTNKSKTMLVLKKTTDKVQSCLAQLHAKLFVTFAVGKKLCICFDKNTLKIYYYILPFNILLKYSHLFQ